MLEIQVKPYRHLNIITLSSIALSEFKDCMIMKTFLITITIVVVLPLMSCRHQSEVDTSQTTQAKLNDVSPLHWRCPGPAYSRQNPDGTIDHWGSCATHIGNFTVHINRGAIVSLGELTSSETIPSRIFNSHTKGETFTSDPIKYVSYRVPHNPSTIRVGYEVTFADCSVDDFTLYIKDQGKDGALEALEYTLKTMKHSSYCNL